MHTITWESLLGFTKARPQGKTTCKAEAGIAFLLTSTGIVFARTPVNTVKADLRPLISAAASSRIQFAVNVPYEVSTESSGRWSTAGGKSTWRYAVRVPTAVSLSFHAVRAKLPESATLTVRGRSTTTKYHAKDLHQSQLWSRIQPGDTL